MDVFFVGKTAHLIRTYRELKYSYGELTLQSLETFNNRKVILHRAEKRAKARTVLFKDGKVKIDWGHQNKHFRDSPHYLLDRSYLTVSREKLQDLVEKYAGTGRAAQRRAIGDIGYKEIVDFKETIGGA